MNKAVMSAAAVGLVGAIAFAFAQTQTPNPTAGGTAAGLSTADISSTAGMRSSDEDRAVLLDARIGAIKAALKLSPDQEKLWDPVEAAIRKNAALRDQRLQEMRNRAAENRDALAPAFDPIARLRNEANRMAARAGRMREFADAAAPLYASLSDDQKRRAFLLLNRSRIDVLGLGEGGTGRGFGRHGASPGESMLDWRG
ncbi:MAG: Spy/CpxP family protein refolding chaperone [Hyphomicrobiales bacterium]|nr:Spy/CpxP family protein refolding chaperone [Hyphomicrobiales bacterium]